MMRSNFNQLNYNLPANNELLDAQNEVEKSKHKVIDCLGTIAINEFHQELAPGDPVAPTDSERKDIKDNLKIASEVLDYEIRQFIHNTKKTLRLSSNQPSAKPNAAWLHREFED